MKAECWMWFCIGILFGLCAGLIVNNSSHRNELIKYDIIMKTNDFTGDPFYIRVK